MIGVLIHAIDSLWFFDCSDTTATALTFLFIQLALYPEWIEHLREEMDPIFAASSYECTRTYPVLDAIINESMRLHPSVFFGSQRETPPQGMQIGETYIPGNTIISIPGYQLARGLSPSNVESK
jgi:cytochrome P450